MDLSAVTTHTLLRELQTRSEHGIAVLESETTGRLDVYWGMRSQCLGLASRIAHVVQRELDVLEDEEAQEVEEEDESGAPEPLQLPLSIGGQYL